jgi:hypothetical protein
MLTPADERRDGGKRTYAEHPAQWRVFDLFDLLATVRQKPQLADLLRIESEDVIRGATFFNELVPGAPDERLSFHRNCLSALKRMRPRILRSRQRPRDPVASKRTEEFKQVRFQGRNLGPLRRRAIGPHLPALSSPAAGEIPGGQGRLAIGGATAREYLVLPDSTRRLRPRSAVRALSARGANSRCREKMASEVHQAPSG